MKLVVDIQLSEIDDLTDKVILQVIAGIHNPDAKSTETKQFMAKTQGYLTQAEPLIEELPEDIKQIYLEELRSYKKLINRLDQNLIAMKSKGKIDNFKAEVAAIRNQSKKNAEEIALKFQESMQVRQELEIKMQSADKFYESLKDR